MSCAVERDLAKHLAEEERKDAWNQAVEAKGDEIADDFRLGHRRIDNDDTLLPDITESLSVDDVAALVYRGDEQARLRLKQVMDREINTRAEQLSPDAVKQDEESARENEAEEKADRTMGIG